MDDWQSAAFNNRHLHNRVDGRHSKKAKGGKGSAVFNPRNSLGSYSIKSSAASTSSASKGHDRSSLEIHQFSDEGEGLIGTLLFPGLLQATIALAGSRDELNKVAKGLGYGSGGSTSGTTLKRWSSASVTKQINTEASKESQDADNDENEDDEDTEEEEEATDEEEESEKENDTRFEKNSFRNPKFWMQWQGQLLGDTASEQVTNGSGYVVFTGNDCKKFSGTLSCEALEWKNIKMTGWKTAWKAERDLVVSWE